MENYAFQFDAVLNTFMRGNLHKIMNMTLGESALSCSVRPMVMPKVNERFRIRLRFTMTCPRSTASNKPSISGGGGGAGAGGGGGYCSAILCCL